MGQKYAKYVCTVNKLCAKLINVTLRCVSVLAAASGFWAGEEGKIGGMYYRLVLMVCRHILFSRSTMVHLFTAMWRVEALLRRMKQTSLVFWEVGNLCSQAQSTAAHSTSNG
jgi:hypothetical protein